MADFAHLKPDFTSQPRYLPLVSMGGLLGQWSGSYIYIFWKSRGNFAVHTKVRNVGMSERQHIATCCMSEKSTNNETQSDKRC